MPYGRLPLLHHYFFHRLVVIGVRHPHRNRMFSGRGFQAQRVIKLQRIRQLAHRRRHGPFAAIQRILGFGNVVERAGGDVQEGRQESHRASGRRAKVFFSVRKKRSWRATFLVREETRLSRSTVTPKAVWMRSKSSETWSGDRAFLSTS